MYECDNQGQKYVIPGHDITFRIPKFYDDATDKQLVYFEVGVAMNGPFNFPKDYYPVSPILWLDPVDKTKSIEMLIQIFLPHCLAETSISKEQVFFLRSSIEEADANGSYGNFALYESGTDVHESFGIIESNYKGGIFCIAQLKSSANNGTDREYCLAQVNLITSPPLHEFHFFALYNLATHMRVRLNTKFPPRINNCIVCMYSF